MGELAKFPTHGHRDVYAPVNEQPNDDCRVMVFNTSVHIPGCVGVQYVLRKFRARGYHAITTPDSEGVIIRYTEINPEGFVSVHPVNSNFEPRVYRLEEVDFIGLVVQFIQDWDSGARWEFIVGDARVEQTENVFARPVLVAN